MIPLVEELKKLKFEQQLKKVNRIKDRQAIISKLYERNYDKLQRLYSGYYKNENEKKFGVFLSKTKKEDFLLNSLKIFFSDKDFNYKNEFEKKNIFIKDIESILEGVVDYYNISDEKEIKESLKQIFYYYIHLGELYSGNILFQLLLNKFYFLIYYYEYLRKSNEKIVYNCELSNLIINLESNYNYNWILLESEEQFTNFNKEQVHTLEKRDKEKPSINIFLTPENFKKITTNELINGIPYVSIFNKEYIVVIEIYLEKIKEFNLAELEKAINEKTKKILEKCPPTKKVQFHLYIKDGHKLIPIEESSKMFLSYLQRVIYSKKNEQKIFIEKVENKEL